VPGGAEAAIAPADPAAPEARACVAHYYAEIAARFEGGFDPGLALQPEDEALRPPRGVFLLATTGDAPLGCVAVRIAEPGVADLKRLWVAPESRGLGLARRLIAAAEEAARGLGAATIRLDTNRALGEAIALYRACGYREVPAFNAEPYAHHWFSKAL
jgi:GNAT superfamily N-acetyltransferase